MADILGTEESEVLPGTPERDTIAALGGADVVLGFEGNDDLDGGPGNDTVIGGRGSDTALGDDGDDRLIWNNGDGSDLMDGGAGEQDVVEVNGAATAGDVFQVAAGGTGALFERLNLGPFQLDISNAERLEVNGSGGDDVLTVGDLLDTGLATVVFSGGDGDDVLDGSATATALVADGGGGNDVFEGGAGDDDFFGSAGNDLLSGNAGDDVLAGGSGDDDLRGGDGNDDLAGGSGNDTLFGDDGDDELEGGSGNDLLLGGLGDDILVGGSGDDDLFGGAGGDELTGGSGNDSLNGGAGPDSFAFLGSEEPFGLDEILGFQQGEDVIALSGFAGLGSFDDLGGAIAVVGRNTVIDLSDAFGNAAGTDTITVTNVTGLEAADVVISDGATA